MKLGKISKRCLSSKCQLIDAAKLIRNKNIQNYKGLDLFQGASASTFELKGGVAEENVSQTDQNGITDNSVDRYERGKRGMNLRAQENENEFDEV